MPGNDKPLKNSLNISLAESAVFLRTNDTSGRNRYNDSRPTMLRGLLTLELVKPTRISSIQLELQARSSIAWPEGVGAHRTDVTEVHKVYSSTQSVFKAGTNARTASMGTEFASTEDIDFEDEDASTLRNRSQGAQSPSVATARSSSITSRPTNRSARRTSGDSWYRFRGTPSLRSDDAQSSIIENMPPTPPYSPSISTTASSSLNHIPYTTQSAVSSRAPSIHSPSITTASSLHGLGYPPSSFHGLDQVDEDSMYQEARIGWREDSQQHRERREQRQSGSFASRSRSVTSSRSIRSHSGRPSVDDVPEQAEAEAGPSNFNYESQFTSSPTSDEPHSTSTHDEPSRSPSLTRGRKKRFSVSSVTSLIKDVVKIRSRSVKRDSRDESEKKRKRRSSSVFSWMSRGTERDDGDKTSISRGRTMEKDSRNPASIMDGSNSAYGVANASATNGDHSAPGISSGRQPNETDVMSVGSGARGESPTPAPSVQSGTRDGRTSRTSFRLSGILDHHKEGVDERRNEGDGWKEFKKGIYTYPICFQVPGHAPPSLEATFGSVTWRLKASVHRPGAFSSKMSTQRDVLVLSCPSEEDTEDTENIIVERHWDGQLQYLISISGRSFYVGGTIPISFTMLPLAKVRVHRLSVILEEKVEYHNNFRSVGRTDPVSTTQLLSVREEGKGRDAKHILPLESDDTNALLNSPLYPVLNLPSEEYARDEALTDMASTLMGPGPWTFHQELQLPASCRSLHPTNKNRRSNISITHLLKCIMRVERGDDQAVDEKTGKRKLFDIVVQTPVMILACRCNPEWTALPYYSEHLEDPTSIAPQCPCVTRRLEREHEMMTTDSNSPQVSPSFHSTWSEGVQRLSSDSSQISNAETSPLHQNMTSLRNRDNLILRNSQFERLVSGQESELGESPPPYEKEIPPNSFKIGAPYQTAMFVSAVH